MLHKLMHFLKLNHGRVISNLDDNGAVWVGFQCDKCGKIEGAYKTRI